MHLSDKEDMSHKFRGPPVTKKLDDDRLEDIRRSFEVPPTMSMHMKALHRNMDEETMENAVKQLQMTSRVCDHHRLLTQKQKEIRGQPSCGPAPVLTSHQWTC